MDAYIQTNLILAALHIALNVLTRNGTFVAKVFRFKNEDLLVSQMRTMFTNVSLCKPSSSRNSSIGKFSHIIFYVTSLIKIAN